MSSLHHLALREGAAIEAPAGGGISIRWGARGGSIAGASPAVRDAVLRLARESVPVGELADRVLAEDGWPGLARLQSCLLHLEQWSVLLRSVHAEGGRLATLVPCSRGLPYAERSVREDTEYVLSRFACVRADAGELVLESPLAHARVVLHEPRVAFVIHALARPARAAALRGAGGLDAEATDALLGLLAGGGFAVEVGPGAAPAEERNPALWSWEFHDLVFHARSREGRHDRPSGATFRFAGELAPPPPLKPPMSAETLELFRPDLERLRREDAPFERVLGDRRSIRAYGDAPITRDQLGELLYRAARVTSVTRVDVPTPRGTVETVIARRPYPSAGALYELELYLAVARCEGLAPGLYHYDPERHRLEKLAARSEDVEPLLRDAAAASQIPREQLQTLVILSARFQRLAWKYAAMAYAAILKHVGCVYQTLYLVATAMGLAPCAIGSGDSDRFARAAGTDYYEEASVGELLLGTPRT